MKREELLNVLLMLLPAQFEILRALMDFPTHLLEGSQAKKTIALLEHFERYEGGLSQIEKTLRSMTNPPPMPAPSKAHTKAEQNLPKSAISDEEASNDLLRGIEPSLRVRLIRARCGGEVKLSKKLTKVNKGQRTAVFHACGSFDLCQFISAPTNNVPSLDPEEAQLIASSSELRLLPIPEEGENKGLMDWFEGSQKSVLLMIFFQLDRSPKAPGLREEFALKTAFQKILGQNALEKKIESRFFLGFGQCEVVAIIKSPDFSVLYHLDHLRQATSNPNEFGSSFSVRPSDSLTLPLIGLECLNMANENPAQLGRVRPHVLFDCDPGAELRVGQHLCNLIRNAGGEVRGAGLPHIKNQGSPATHPPLFEAIVEDITGSEDLMMRIEPSIDAHEFFNLIHALREICANQGLRGTIVQLVSHFEQWGGERPHVLEEVRLQRLQTNLCEIRDTFNRLHDVEPSPQLLLNQLHRIFALMRGHWFGSPRLRHLDLYIAFTGLLEDIQGELSTLGSRHVDEMNSREQTRFRASLRPLIQSARLLRIASKRRITSSSGLHMRPMSTGTADVFGYERSRRAAVAIIQDLHARFQTAFVPPSDPSSSPNWLGTVVFDEGPGMNARLEGIVAVPKETREHPLGAGGWLGLSWILAKALLEEWSLFPVWPQRNSDGNSLSSPEDTAILDVAMTIWFDARYFHGAVNDVEISQTLRCHWWTWHHVAQPRTSQSGQDALFTSILAFIGLRFARDLPKPNLQGLIPDAENQVEALTQKAVKILQTLQPGLDDTLLEETINPRIQSTLKLFLEGLAEFMKDYNDVLNRLIASCPKEQFNLPKALQQGGPEALLEASRHSAFMLLRDSARWLIAEQDVLKRQKLYNSKLEAALIAVLSDCYVQRKRLLQDQLLLTTSLDIDTTPLVSPWPQVLGEDAYQQLFDLFENVSSDWTTTRTQHLRRWIEFNQARLTELRIRLLAHLKDHPQQAQEELCVVIFGPLNPMEQSMDCWKAIQIVSSTESLDNIRESTINELCWHTEFHSFRVLGMDQADDLEEQEDEPKTLDIYQDRIFLDEILQKAKPLQLWSWLIESTGLLYKNYNFDCRKKILEALLVKVKATLKTKTLQERLHDMNSEWGRATADRTLPQKDRGIDLVSLWRWKAHRLWHCATVDWWLSIQTDLDEDELWGVVDVAPLVRVHQLSRDWENSPKLLALLAEVLWAYYSLIKEMETADAYDEFWRDDFSTASNEPQTDEQTLLLDRLKIIDSLLILFEESVQNLDRSLTTIEESWRPPSFNSRNDLPAAGANSTEICVLHIAGIKYDLEDHEPAKNMLEALKRDLQYLEKEEGLRPDLICLTGDISRHGQLAEFEEAHAQFLQPLCTHLELPLDRLSWCPGNHDVDVTNIARLSEAGLVAELEKSSDADTILLNPDDRVDAFKRLIPYSTFTRACLGERLLGQQDPAYFTTQRVTLSSGVEVGIACLNSAWRCSRKGEEGDLFLGRHQIEAAARELENTFLSIALVHHSFSRLHSSEQETLKRLCVEKFSLVLHSHRTDPFNARMAYGDKLRRLMFRSENHGEIFASRSLISGSARRGYSLVRMRESGQSEVWLRSYHAEIGFQEDADSKRSKSGRIDFLWRRAKGLGD